MQTRKAARAVVIDESGKTVLIEALGGVYYKIPGGGIEAGETEQQAVMREVLEETGCNVEIGEKVGEQDFLYEDADGDKAKNWSVCYLAKKIGEQGKTNYDEVEKNRSMKPIWCSFDEAIALFDKFDYDSGELIRQKINDRDKKFLIMARELLKTIK